MEQGDLLFIVSFTFGPVCGLLFAGRGIEERTAHVNTGISATISRTLELRLTFTRFRHFLPRYCATYVPNPSLKSTIPHRVVFISEISMELSYYVAPPPTRVDRYLRSRTGESMRMSMKRDSRRV